MSYYILKACFADKVIIVYIPLKSNYDSIFINNDLMEKRLSYFYLYSCGSNPEPQTLDKCSITELPPQSCLLVDKK